MNKKVLIILGHPQKKSYCGSLANAYKEGALSTKAEVKEIILSELNYDPYLHAGYKEDQELEPDLQKAQEFIKWAEHIVFVYPTWWGTFPAILKGFIDRTIIPGFGFNYRKDSVWWDKLLAGRSAHLIVTMDTPPWFYRLSYGRPGHNAMKKSTLEFCGIKPVRITSIGSIKASNEEKRQKWIEKIKRYGEQLK